MKTDSSEPALIGNPPVAIVTGAGRRIGSAIATALHEAGYRVLLHYRLSGEGARKLEADFNARRSDSAACFAGDMADDALPEALAQTAIGRWGRLDALVNNASSFYPTALETLTPAQFGDLIASNLKGPLFLAKACAARMRSGAIVNVLDIHARKPMPGYVAYCAAKAGLWSVTESLAIELAPRIRVNGVAPGRMIWGVGDKLDEAERLAEQQRIPMKQLGGGAEVARTVRFLLSDEAGYINGAVLPVDGGLRLT
jgi:pteridine reductase